MKPKLNICLSVCFYLIGQVQHAEVGLQLKAERGQGRGASFGPGELVEDDGIFRVQLFLLSVWEQKADLTLESSLVPFFPLSGFIFLCGPLKKPQKRMEERGEAFTQIFSVYPEYI